MNDEWGNEPEVEEEKPESEDYYHFSNNEIDDEPKWEPNIDKYNSRSEEKASAQPRKRKSLWWIPVAAVMTVIVAAVVLGAVFGIRLIRSGIQKTDIPSQIVEEIEAIAGAEDAITESEESGLIINEGGNISKTNPTGSGIYLTDVSDIVENVMPSVVSITSRTLVNNGGYGGFFYYYYGNQNSGQTQEVESGIGSGTIVGQNDKELLILTSYHVVEGSSSLYVTFCNDDAVDGYIKAASENDDIAIVAVPLEDISDSTSSAIRMAVLSDEEPDVGDGAIVIGNALGYGQSVVTGIVSALDRQITVEGKTVTVIQTDAAINSGNSGGCLLNSDGAIIGISEAKISSSSVEGMCYAISVHYYYDKIMEMLGEEPLDREDGSGNNNSSQGAYLGIYGYDIGSQLAQSYDIPEGVYVVNTVTGGGAEAAGIKEGDVIIGLDDEDISSMEELQSELRNYSAGDTVKITLMRSANNGYEKKEFNVTLTSPIG